MSELIQKKSLKILFWLAVTIIATYFFYTLINIFLILAVAFLLAFIFAPFIHLIEQRGFNRLASSLIVFTVFGFLVYLGLSFVIPKLFFQMDQLILSLEGFSLTEELKSFEAWIYHYLPLFETGEISKRVEHFISSQIVNSFENITSLVSSLLTIAAVLVIVPFITFFLLKDSAKIQRAVIQVVPNKYFEMSYWILKRISLQLGRFVRAWIFDATFVGVCIGFGFYLIGLPNALPLGVIAGLGHLIPYLGPIFGGIPAIVISIIQFGDLSQVPLIFLIVILTYAFDNGFVQPYVFAKSVDIHPIVIILLIIAGGQLFGLFGMLLAVPTVSVIKTFVKEIYFATKNYRIARV
ncbi:MAG: AI-2E family transporter [Ignavibacteriaceae bacterium]|nr:AI-2E family transporter [Ignavibacteriaceae bacterium]